MVIPSDQVRSSMFHLTLTNDEQQTLFLFISRCLDDCTWLNSKVLESASNHELLVLHHFKNKLDLKVVCDTTSPIGVQEEA